MPDLRNLRTRGRRGRVPRPLAPVGIQLSYYSELKKMLSRARELVRERLVVRLPELLDRAQVLHADAPHSPGRVNRILDQISEALYRAYPQERLERLSLRIARASSEHQKNQLMRQVKAAVGIDLQTIATPGLAPRIRQFVAENVALIKTVPQQYFDDVEREVLAGMRSGARAGEISDALEERAGVAESRAKLIARDQVLKFNGDLNHVRQQDLGVEKYIWRTVDDSRVRDVHAERDGQVFSWDDPPGDPEDPHDGGHPGMGINCRCSAEPVVDEILAALEE